MPTSRTSSVSVTSRSWHRRTIRSYAHFDIPLDIQRNPFRKLETTFPRTRRVSQFSQWVEIPAAGRKPLKLTDRLRRSQRPFYEQWPPKTHTAIFFRSDNQGDEGKYGRRG